MSEAATMMNRAELKQYKADFDTVQNSLDHALTYLGAEERLAAACEDLRGRWQAAKTCGEALQRIHDTKSYRDQHKDWSAFCRSLTPAISIKHVYRLMKCAEVLATIPAGLIGKIEIPLSFRLLGDLGKLDSSERAKLFDAAANAPDGEAARETLREGMKSSSPKRGRPQILDDMDKVRSHTGAIEDWFADFGGEKQVRPLIRDLLALAERFVAANRSAA